jgi:predicted ATPase/DNA-binding CsgD family transcriptional regulator
MVANYQVDYNDIFVGRFNPLQELRAMLDRTEEGKAHMVLVQGEAGIGKTHLAREFIRHGENRGWLVLKGSAQRGLAFAPLIEALRTEVDRLDANQKQQLGRSYLYLNALIPSLGGPLPEPLAQPSLERARLFENLRLFTVSLCTERPLLIWMDDMDEADNDTLEWIHYFIQHTKQGRIMFLATCQNAYPSESNAYLKLVQYLSRYQRLQTIELEPLSPSESSLLIQSQLHGKVEESIVELLHSRTRGFPFYILELVNSLLRSGGLYQHDGGWKIRDGAADQIPLSIKLLLEPRINSLAEAETELLCLFIASKRAIPWAVLVKGFHLESKQLSHLLTGLLKKGILHEEAVKDEIVYSLSHPMVKAVVQSKVHLTEIKHAHQRMATAWYEQDVLYAADHILETDSRSGDVVSATILFQAGERYLTMRSYETAIEYLEKAGQYIQSTGSDQHQELRFQISLKLSEALTYKENPQQALLLLHQLYQESQDTQMKIRMKRFMAWVELTRSFEQCLHHLVDGLHLWDGQTENSDVLWMMNARVFNDLNAGQIAEAKQSIQHLHSYAEKFQVQRAKLLYAIREAHLSLMGWNGPPVNLQQANHMLMEAYQLKDPELIYDVYCLFGYNALNYGDYKRSLRYARECKELVRKHGMVIHEISVRLVGMCASFMQGNWEHSYSEAEAIEKLSREYEVSGAVVCTLDIRALILYLQGREEEWRVPFQESQRLTFEVFPEMGINLSDDALHVLSAVDYILKDKPIEPKQRSVYWANAHGMQYFLRLLEGIRLIKAGLKEEVEELIQKLRASVPDKNPNYISGILSLLTGLLAFRNKDLNAAADHLNMAVKSFDKLRLPFEKALARVFLSDVSGPEQAKLLLEQSNAEFQGMGAMALCDWANKRLAAYEMPASNFIDNKLKFPAIVETLTKREAEILQTLAIGLSNKEIAIKLVVTEGTIKNHIVNIYGKLAVSSRVQAIVKARKYGIID